MKKNMGGTDKAIRIIAAIIIGILVYSEVISGTLAYVLLALATIFIITGFLNFCPLYKLFGISTCKTKE